MIGPRKIVLKLLWGDRPKELALLLLRTMARVNFAFLVAFVLVALTTLVSAAKGPVISNKGKMIESRLIDVWNHSGPNSLSKSTLTLSKVMKTLAVLSLVFLER
jgi:hypothetical protein